MMMRCQQIGTHYRGVPDIEKPWRVPMRVLLTNRSNWMSRALLVCVSVRKIETARETAREIDLRETPAGSLLRSKVTCIYMERDMK